MGIASVFYKVVRKILDKVVFAAGMPNLGVV
jgi:hypothetical protein